MLGFNESDMDGPNEFAGGEVENPIARAIIAVSNEHAAVLWAKAGRVTKDLDASEDCGDTMTKGVGNTPIITGSSGRGEAVVKVDTVRIVRPQYLGGQLAC
jgi:cobalamin-dependent methionine synthase I